MPLLSGSSRVDDALGRVDYDEYGTGPTVVLVPGSCSTGAAWRPIIAAWKGEFRSVTTSLLGYGGTAERRSAEDPSIWHETDVVEAVARKAGERIHLVGHSFGGLVALTVALRKQVPLASLVVIEAPAAELLRDRGEDQHYRAFRQFSDAYIADFHSGNPEAVGTMIDFYGGAGTFASWPPRIREYAIQTTAVNILDWASAYGFPLSAASLATIDIPVLVIRGGASPQAVQRANELLSEWISGAALTTVDRAAHFLIATHADEVARVIAKHVREAEQELDTISVE